MMTDQQENEFDKEYYKIFQISCLLFKNFFKNNSSIFIQKYHTNASIY